MKKAVLHPFLFAIYPVLLLFSNNIDRTQFSQATRLIVVLFLAVVLMLLFFRLLTLSWSRAGMITSLFLLLFTSYGHVYNVLKGTQVLGIPLGRADVLAALYAALFIFWGWFAWRKLRDPDAPGLVLNVTAFALICFPVILIMAFSPQAVTSPGPTLQGCVPLPQASTSSLPKPDIYYIILDEYGRSDMLAQVMNYDNSEFIDQLKSRGFFIAEGSYSNYAISLMSIASSLNLCYLNEYVSPEPGMGPQNTSLLSNSIWHSNARTYLEAAGYRFVTIASGYSPTDIADSDLYLNPENYINPFEIAFIRGSALAIFFDEIQAIQSRTMINTAFENLSSLPETNPGTPTFVFAHIQTNHVPYVFGPDGEAVHPWAFSPGGASRSNLILTDGRTYASAYQDQAEYINKIVLKTVDQILLKSSTKPIIILQGDHGTQMHLNWLSEEDTCVKERHSILNAYYFPDGDDAGLYAEVTPVNSFRILFNTFFGLNLPLYSDRVYFSEWIHSYDFIDVTEKMKDCEPK